MKHHASSTHRMDGDAPDRHKGQTENQTSKRMCLFVSFFVCLFLRWTASERVIDTRIAIQMHDDDFLL